MAKAQEQALPPPPPIVFKASGQNDQAAQANLITARQSPGYYFASVLMADAAMKRADQVLLDYTRDAVGVRFQIDGLWHNMPPRDRQSGDVMLAVLKKMCDLNPGERRARQQGKFKAEFFKARLDCSLTSQGVPTGERAVIKLVDKKSPIKLETLDDLGMREKMRDRFKELINGTDPFFLIVSAMPGDGLTTTFRATLNACDRLLRDFVQIQSSDYDDAEVINVDPVKFNPQEGGPDKVLPAVLLKQPNVLVVPELTNAETVNILCEQVLHGNMPAITRVNAKEAVEALLRVMAYKGSVEQYSQVVSAVLNVRLCRRLCPTCKQGYQPPPQLLHKLGIPPGRVQLLYKQWEPPPPPPPEMQKGPLPEPVICRDCGGMGYKGRIAIFEYLTVTPEMRQALVKQPKLDVLRALAKKAGHRNLQEGGILLVAMGLTSLAELQRVLKQ
jgi:type II secretory ATPase GspE/PulE/Tfp pilus assembly ATPase PilB-like protein